MGRITGLLALALIVLPGAALAWEFNCADGTDDDGDGFVD